MTTMMMTATADSVSVTFGNIKYTQENPGYIFLILRNDLYNKYKEVKYD